MWSHVAESALPPSSLERGQSGERTSGSKCAHGDSGSEMSEDNDATVPFNPYDGIYDRLGAIGTPDVVTDESFILKSNHLRNGCVPAEDLICMPA